MAKKDKKQLALDLILKDNNFQFISGKYFYNNNEIVNPDKYITLAYRKEYGEILYAKDVKEILSTIQNLSDTTIWPELPIITEAKKLGAINSDKDAPFQLDKKQLIILNILLYHPYDEVMFITTGIGGSGKSTFLNIVKQLFNNDYAAIPLSELTGFMVAQAVSKRLICSDELGKGDLDSKILKTLISRQQLDVNPKYGIPYHAQCQSSLFYCCNKAPKIDITDTGILRRIIFYERNTKIENPDTSLNHVQYTYEQLLWFARRALAAEQIYPRWKEVFVEETHKYLMKENSVFICKAETYPEYREKCTVKGLKPFSEPNWQEIKAVFEEWQA